MGNDVGRVGDAEQALAVPATPAVAVDGPMGFDPSRVGGSTSLTYDPEYEASLMLPKLSAPQRDFIMRAKPHCNDQRLKKSDWEHVEPSVELQDYPAYRIWFGGMRVMAGPGIRGWQRTFRFSPAGLLVRAAIAMETREGGDAKLGSGEADSAAIAQQGSTP